MRFDVLPYAAVHNIEGHGCAGDCSDCVRHYGLRNKCLAAEATCGSRANEKKLAGAALTSLMKKCEAHATKACETSVTEKKFGGAAKTSFTKKCVSDAVGT
jgi:hypothetical protein